MLDLIRLRYLVVLSRKLSYARAAEELGISQPALTRAIQALERQFELRLFDRDRSNVSLTATGRLVAEQATALLANADDMERQFDLTSRGQFGHVRFGMAPMVARALLTATLNDRLNAAPQVANDVVVRNVEALWPLLTGGELEFFISAEGQIPDSTPIRTELIGQFPLSLIVRADHPLLHGECIGSKFPILHASRRELHLPAQIANRVRGTPHMIEDYETLTALTIASDALWLSSPYAVLAEIRAGRLMELPAPANIHHSPLRIVVHALERRSQSPSARAIIQTMRSGVQRLRGRYDALEKNAPKGAARSASRNRKGGSGAG